MRQRICICIRICIFIFTLLFTDTVCAVYADNNSNSKLTVFLSGDVIEKIQVTLEFENDEPIVFAVPCGITNQNIKYDDKNFLFDFISYEEYSLCVAVPIGKIEYFNIDILNEHNEIYEGITLKGTVTNGEYEMHLSIPVIERKSQWGHYVYQFETYSIVQAHPYSSIAYSKDGRKVLTEELTGKELLLPVSSEQNIDYAYSMARTIKEESSALSIITCILVPVLVCVFQLLYPDENKEKILSIRNIILYLIMLGSAGYAIYLSWNKEVPIWAFVAVLLIFLLCCFLIMRSIIKRWKILKSHSPKIGEESKEKNISIMAIIKKKVNKPVLENKVCVTELSSSKEIGNESEKDK